MKSDLKLSLPKN